MIREGEGTGPADEGKRRKPIFGVLSLVIGVIMVTGGSLLTLLLFVQGAMMALGDSSGGEWITAAFGAEILVSLAGAGCGILSFERRENKWGLAAVGVFLNGLFALGSLLLMTGGCF
jgi:hypothetical protein